ncbi:MAG: NAD-dependent epimerase/dehydratase family protein [Clostridiales bacterium]|jgi:dihydroflavonol-4-reductase|nr:NAD-dependent epimerase/dehydratase family protein [Clostridiales bacterium]
MRAFVTGGSGFIGSHLIDALVRDGWLVRALSHRAPLLQEDRIETLNGDICDRAVLFDGLKEIDVVFHLASALGSTAISKDEFFRINTLGTEVVLEAARARPVSRIIHLSSAGVLGAVRPGDIADESYPPKPASVYDRTKLEAEKTALWAAGQGMDIVIVRPGWAYGPRDRRTFKLIKTVDKKKIIVMPRGKARQTPVYIDDLIRGLLMAARSGKKGEIYHLAGREILTAGEIVKAIAGACAKKRPAVFLPLFPFSMAAHFFEKLYSPLGKEPPLNRAKLSFFSHSKPLSVQKARQELGFSAEVDFHRGIRLTVAWYREQGWL